MTTTHRSVFLAGPHVRTWAPQLFALDDAAPECPPTYGEWTYAGPWTGRDWRPQLRGASALFGWVDRDLDEWTAALLGFANACGVPAFLYTNVPLGAMPHQLATVSEAGSVADAFEDFATTADEEIRFRTCLRAAQQELTETYRLARRRLAPEGITRGWVYLVQSGAMFKIGMTRDLDERLRTVNLQTPERPDLIHTLYAAEVELCEKFLHAVFRGKRRDRSEWFRLSEREVAWMRGLREWRAKEWIQHG
jgi:hypothetical protein